MTTFFLALILLGIVIALMAVGVMFQNKPIKGSCGGMATLGMKTDCDVCGGKPEMCEKSDVLRSDSSVDEDAEADQALSEAMSSPRDANGEALKIPDNHSGGHLKYHDAMAQEAKKP